MDTETKVKETPSFAVIDAIIHKHNVEPGAAIPVLQEIQDTYGYIPPIALERMALNMNVPASELSGIVTFYAQFRLKPLGENLIKVCHGTACHLAGAERISEAMCLETGAKEGETSPDGKFTVERVACLGCCSLAPCMMVNEKIHGQVTPEAIRKLVEQTREAGEVTSAEKAV
jgi:NADH-quinone oxidoreductase subunit E